MPKNGHPPRPEACRRALSQEGRACTRHNLRQHRGSRERVSDVSRCAKPSYHGGLPTSLAKKAGPRTKIVDGDGATLLPGFTDAHVHPPAAGVQLLTCNLAGQPHSLEAYQSTIREYAEANPYLEWISGTGWFGDTFPGGLPTTALLDEVVADRPAVLVSHDGHGVWTNSLALMLAGIDDSTPDPRAVGSTETSWDE